MLYVFVGLTMVGAGVIPFSQVGMASVWIENPDDPHADDSSVLGPEGEGGLLNNLIGPVRSALNTIAGGTVLAAWGAIDTFLGFYAWPVTVARYLNAPTEVILMAFTFVVAFTFGTFRVIKASI